MVAIKIAAVAAFATLVSSATAPSCDFTLSRQAQSRMKDLYIETWNGLFCLENATFTPDVHLFQDRLPTAGGTQVLPVQSSQAFIDFMRRGHASWDQYKFEITNWAGDGYNVVVRWKLHAVVGPRPFLNLTSTRKQGDAASYQGTDWLHLDECTGRIKQVDSSQDFFSLLHDLGVPSLQI